MRVHGVLVKVRERPRTFYETCVVLVDYCLATLGSAKHLPVAEDKEIPRVVCRFVKRDESVLRAKRLSVRGLCHGLWNCSDMTYI